MKREHDRMIKINANVEMKSARELETFVGKP
jgi:hypothetical protein